LCCFERKRPLPTLVRLTQRRSEADGDTATPVRRTPLLTSLGVVRHSRMCTLFCSFNLSSTSVYNDVTLASESAVHAGTFSCAYAMKAHHCQKSTLLSCRKCPRPCPSCRHRVRPAVVQGLLDRRTYNATLLYATLSARHLRVAPQPMQQADATSRRHEIDTFAGRTLASWVVKSDTRSIARRSHIAARSEPRSPSS